MNERTIKFRAWDGKRIARVLSIQFWGSDDAVKHVTLEDGDVVNNPILMQYTGLLDKNGKEIYEGDVVKIDGDKLYVGEIKWGTFGFICDYGKDGTKQHLPDYVKIIGNIYENPDLITKA